MVTASRSNTSHGLETLHTVYPKAAKRSIPCPALHLLNGSTVIIAAAELLLITKKEGSYEIIENPTPSAWDKYSGHDNAISIRISCVSFADCF